MVQNDASTTVELRGRAFEGRPGAKAERGGTNQNATPTGGPIIWAVDPFESDANRSRALLKAIDLWRKGLPSQLLPVSIITADELDWPVELVAPMNDRLVYIANNTVRPLLERISPGESIEPRVVLQRGGSKRKAVEAMIDLATRGHAGLIAVHAHRKRGLKRLGSFTEPLIALSPVPVLVLPPDAEVPTDVDTILFPTDFTDGSRRVFEKAVDWARNWSARLEIMHAYEIPYQLLMDGEWGVGVSYDLVEKYWREAEAEQLEQGLRWADDARRAGVECNFELSKSNGWTGERIISSTLAKRADLIVMSTRRGPLGQTLLGSVARDVLMGAPRPVIVVHES